MTDFVDAVASPIAEPFGRHLLTPFIPGASLTGVLALVVIAVAQGISLWLWTLDAPSDLVWLPGGAFLGALLILPKQRWLSVWIGALLGETLVFGVSSQPVGRALLVTGGWFALTTAMAWVLQRKRPVGRPLEDFSLLTEFTLYAGILVPVMGAAWFMALGRVVGFGAYAFSWLNVALSLCLGYVLVAPIIVGHAFVERSRRLSFSWRAKLIGGLLFSVPCVAWWFHQTLDFLLPLQILAPAPFIVWALLRYGLIGACYAILATALVSFGYSHMERGPFVLGDAGQTNMGLQLLFSCGALVMLYLSVMAEQHRSDHVALDLLNRKLSLMAGNLINAQELERGRIARDLHDDINQSIASVSIKLSMAKQQAEGEVRRSLDQLHEEVIAVSEDVRQLSHRLHPSLLRYTGLGPALRALCNTHAARHYTLEQAIDEGIDPPPAAALALFRIAQEALGNVDNHAQAKRVRVCLCREGSDIVLEIRDDGVGFLDVAHDGREMGLGLISMEERAKGVGASFSIRSHPGFGTRLLVKLTADPNV